MISISEINSDQERPPCKVTRINDPDFELMAKAFLNLYYQTKVRETKIGVNEIEKTNKNN